MDEDKVIFYNNSFQKLCSVLEQCLILSIDNEPF